LYSFLLIFCYLLAFCHTLYIYDRTILHHVLKSTVKPGPHQQQCRTNWQQSCWCGPGYRL